MQFAMIFVVPQSAKGVKGVATAWALMLLGQWFGGRWDRMFLNFPSLFVVSQSVSKESLQANLLLRLFGCQFPFIVAAHGVAK